MQPKFHHQRNRAIKRTVIILTLSVALFLLCLFTLSPNFKQKNLDLNNAAYINSTNPIENNFALIDLDNNQFTAQNFKGKWTLLFFGYADCPHICPVTLSVIRDAINTIPKNKPKPEVVFASLNPEQDTPEKLKAFLHNFDQSFKGITGSQVEMDNLSKQLKIVVSKNNNYTNSAENSGTENNATANSSMPDMINHSSFILLIDPKGQLKALISPPLNAIEIAQDVQDIMG